MNHTVEDWERDPPTYRWRVKVRPPEPGGVEQIVMTFYETYLEVCLADAAGVTRPVEDRRRVLFYGELVVEDPFGLAPVLLSLAQRDIRGPAEHRAVELVFWRLLVRDELGWGLLETQLPGVRAWYNRQLTDVFHVDPPPSRIDGETP